MIEAPTFRTTDGLTAAAIEKTITVPVGPYFHLNDLHLIAGLMAVLRRTVAILWKRKSPL
jgi:hypothetical protein